MPRKTKMAIELLGSIGSLGLDLQKHDEAEIAEAMKLMRHSNAALFNFLSRVLGRTS